MAEGQTDTIEAAKRARACLYAPPAQVVYADITQPKTLSPSFLKGVKCASPPVVYKAFSVPASISSFQALTCMPAVVDRQFPV